MEWNDRLEALCRSIIEEERAQQKKRREVSAYLEKVVEEQMELDECEMDTELIDRCVEMLLWLAGEKIHNEFETDTLNQAQLEDLKQTIAQLRDDNEAEPLT